MTIQEFELKYTTYYEDEQGNRVMFNPLHKKGIGSMTWEYKRMPNVGGEYEIKQEGNDLYIGIKGKMYLFVPTEVGFNLVIGEAVHYRFTKIK